MVMKLFGIRNCDTMKKARQWLDARGIDYAFHDYKKQGVDRGHLNHQIQAAGWESLVNKRGTTWRKLPEGEQARLVDAASAVELLSEHSSMIKRPILDTGNDVLVGFDEKVWSERLG